ncbi:MAG: UDP-N-acetylglucosamine 2-epimerase (non-hydrolyzing) [Bacteroidia bacterium]|nr:UDP-N-acetylglucosamine 2-epimerase (non-hydrolyzing) [Bacteroidia bacterium]
MLTIIGARPQIIKAAALSRTIQKEYSQMLQEIIVHTGQHYDNNMSQIFFDELNIPKENINLNVGSSSHGKQTANMLEKIEEVLQDKKPDAVVVYGDTNSTLAGALAASKLLIPVFHIEAGLRSYNKTMPEEINRIMADHVSTLLFCPTQQAIKNLEKEGFKPHTHQPHINYPKVILSGDVMYDNSLYFSKIAEKKSNILQKFNLQNSNFILCTIHRNNNTDIPEKLNSIFNALIHISKRIKIILPLHPRTKKMMQTHLASSTLNQLQSSENIIITEPVSFLDMISLEKHCTMVITDSGGVQKEAYFFKKPCIVLRAETEWTELLDTGTTFLADSDFEKIIHSFETLKDTSVEKFIPHYGNGNAAKKIAEEITSFFNQ